MSRKARAHVFLLLTMVLVIASLGGASRPSGTTYALSKATRSGQDRGIRTRSRSEDQPLLQEPGPGATNAYVGEITQPTGISIAPLEALVCDTATITISLESIDNLYGYQFEVLYDDSLVNASAFFVDSFFDTASDSSIPPEWSATCAAGTCRFAVSKVAPGDPKSGSGPVARIDLSARSPGTFDLTIQRSLMGDRDGQEIAHSTDTATITVCGRFLVFCPMVLGRQVAALSADNNTTIDMNDLLCISGDLGGLPGNCGDTGSSDINTDGSVNILDLVLAGGKYGLGAPQAR